VRTIRTVSELLEHVDWSAGGNRVEETAGWAAGRSEGVARACG
jgi:hypothetical protein